MMIERLQQYMRVVGYSPKTIEAYVRCIEEIGEHDLMVFLDKLAMQHKSTFTLNQYHAAYKLYKTKILPAYLFDSTVSSNLSFDSRQR